MTGAAGFLGTHLVAELRARGTEVVALAHRDCAAYRAVDLADLAAVRAVLRETRPDVVFHLAGSFRADGYARLLHVNCGLAAVLLDALAAEGLTDARTMFVGTAAEYGPVPADEGLVVESRPARPTSAYGVTKLAQTELALAAARAGARTLVVRPSNVIGAGMSQLLSMGSFACQAADIRAGRTAPVLHVGDLSAVRDFVDVRDVARAMAELAGCDGALGRVFNVARGTGHGMREALDALVHAFGIDVEIRFDASRGSQSTHVSRFVASTEALTGLVSHRPRSLRESMDLIAAGSL